MEPWITLQYTCIWVDEEEHSNVYPARAIALPGNFVAAYMQPVAAGKFTDRFL
jgi:hypothetical protein